MTNYQIQTSQLAGKWQARLTKEVKAQYYDVRDHGLTNELIAISLATTESAAIEEVVQEWISQ